MKASTPMTVRLTAGLLEKVRREAGSWRKDGDMDFSLTEVVVP
ncbi:MAG TPA: hypothetical protein VL528_07660 [Oxalicibacterium sp.]|nr:hypothetical protein [Oxalicibacterium sp.]